MVSKRKNLSKKRPKRSPGSSRWRLVGKPDLLILALGLALTLLGIIIVYDASAATALSNYGDQWYFFKLQLKWAVAGLGLAGLAYLVPIELWHRLAKPLFLITLALLAITLIPGLSEEHLGARRWLSLGGINFQPSELLKITLSLYLAKVLSEEVNFSRLIKPLVLSLGLVVLGPDLSTTIILGLSAITIYWVAGVSSWQLLGLLGLTGLGGGLLTITKSYRVARWLTFLDPTRDPLGASYHVRQILIALGSGGWRGVGLGQSRQKYAYLPAATTDSIMAVVAEEVGFLGATVVVVTLAILVLRCYRVTARAKNKFASLWGVGLASWLGIQILVNLAAVVVLIPVTGVPLPLISYGGSSLVVALVSLAILLKISAVSEVN